MLDLNEFELLSFIIEPENERVGRIYCARDAAAAQGMNSKPDYASIKSTQPHPPPKKSSLKQTKRVQFAKTFTTQIYERPDDISKKQLFYTRADYNTFSITMKSSALEIRGHIKKEVIRQDSSFNELTGLPSPEVLKKHLRSPEDIVGIEQLLCGRESGCANLNLRRNHARVLLEEQCKEESSKKRRRNSHSSRLINEDENSLPMNSHKYSSIMATLAVCRASYAAMV